MKIQFSTDGDELVVETTINVPTCGEAVFTSKGSLGSNHYAAFVADAAREQLGQNIEDVRRHEYCRGWKDAKAHNTKQTWFSRLLALPTS